MNDFARQRFKLELQLLRCHLPVLLVSGAYIIYFIYMVFRNLAFYRFESGDRLKDIGYELLPEMNGPGSSFADIPMYFVSLGLLVLCLYTFIPSQSEGSPIAKKPFAVNILVRYIAMLVLGHTLRFMTYFPTSLPGTADQCLGDVSKIQPTTLVEVFFTRFALEPGENCGDLMFSGHMLQMITPVMLVSFYGKQVFEYSDRAHTMLLGFLTSCIFAMAVLIIARRNHYTQDVIAGSYITPLLWHFYTRVIHKEDLAIQIRGV